MIALPWARALRRPCNAAALLLLLSACAAPPPAGGPALTAAGRLSVRVDAAAERPAQSLSAGFEWRGNGERGALTLFSPLGTQVAQAQWAPGEATLLTAEGSARFMGLEELAERALGERVPLGAWPDWLAGRPWPGAPSMPWGAAGAATADGSGFEQLGWQVDTSRLAAEGRLLARRAAPPVVTVRIVLDREVREGRSQP